MNFEDEILHDVQEDAFIIQYVQDTLPEAVAERFEEEDLYYILDVTEEYFAESGVLDAPGDDEGFVDIDLEAAAKFVAQKAKKEFGKTFATDDLEQIIEAQLTYAEEREE